MELNKMIGKGSAFIKKHIFVVLILALGISFMLIPEETEEIDVPKELLAQKEERNLEEHLAEILSLIEGAGSVKVMLTVATGEETVFQTDTEQSINEQSTSARNATIVVSGEDNNEEGLVKQRNPPQYLGAVIVCQGADDPRVRLAVVDAVSKVTGLGTDRISISKMK